MDSQRTLLVFGVGALVVLGVLITLLPVLLQGFQPQPMPGLVSREQERDIFQQDYLDEVAPVKRAPEVRRARVLAPVPEDFAPRTLSEKKWAAAMAKLEAQEKRQKADQERFDSWKDFLDSPTGGSIQSSFELLRRGKAGDAANLLETVLPDIVDLDQELQQPILKAAVRLFKAAGRTDLLAQTLATYLRNLEETLTSGGLEGRTKRAQAELLDEVREYLSDARVTARGTL